MMTNKIALLIFSKNRACQMDLLLRSILRNAPGEFNIKVLYTYENTDSDYLGGYNKILYDSDYSNQLNEDNFYFEGVEFCPFKETVLNIMEGCEEELFMFLTDDCVFFRAPEIQKMKDALRNFPDEVGVATLRVGLSSTIDCYYNGQRLPQLNYVNVDDGLVGWRHQDYPPNSAYQYALSLDAHIFRTAEIYDLVKNTEFNSPNTLEASLSHKTNMLKPYMVAGLEQSCVAVPVNSVAMWNQSGSQFPCSTEFLNNQFLSGFEIDMDAAIEYCKEKISSTHGEIPYSFIKR